jgi:hypothetical protein
MKLRLWRESKAVIFWWPSPAQSFLVSGLVRIHDHISVRSKTACRLLNGASSSLRGRVSLPATLSEQSTNLLIAAAHGTKNLFISCKCKEINPQKTRYFSMSLTRWHHYHWSVYLLGSDAVDSGIKFIDSRATLLPACLLDLFFDTEDGGSKFLRNVSNFYQTTRRHFPEDRNFTTTAARSSNLIIIIKRVI